MAEERVQRRLAAILAADVVGYSRLMSGDETGTLTALKQHRAALIDPTIAEHRGRIVKLMGDGVLVEFASVVDAVECAVSIQRGMTERNVDTPDNKRITFRIGVNLGDIIIDDDDIYGDGVNVAARLEGLAEPGGICVSEKVFSEVRTKLEIDFDDLGPQQVKNIAEPVRAYRVTLDRGPVAPKAAPLSLPDKPSIAVLPFDNMSGDPEQEYFADGIAEDLITSLSRFRWFFVIARNSSFTYKGKAVDMKQVAAELGVQYVIEGSVRKAGNRVRITSQLVDAATGRHIWAERYDRDLSDIFEVQDEITTAITGAVSPLFAAAESQRASRKAPENLDAWDLAMRANGHVWRVNKTDLREAQRLFAEALELDPNSSFAQSGLAFAYMREAGASLAEDFLESRDKAYKAAQRAIELDEQDARGHLSLAWVYHVRHENELAATECRTALQLNPNLADAEGFLGLINAHLGGYDEALLHIDQAVRLSPQDPSMQFWNLTPVIAALVADRPEEYFEHAKVLTERSPNFIPGIRHLAAANANLGRLEEAEIAVEKALNLVPNDTITSILESVPIADTAARDRYIDGLRKAGYPQ